MMRRPAVAGQFYPGNPRQLTGMIESFVEPRAAKAPALAAVCPHAGYIYSGAVAAKVLSRVEIPRKVVVLGPNHRGLGARVAVMARGAWITPLGSVELDEDLASALITAGDLAEEDSLAHQYEHSLEVQVPFLQYFRDDLLLTPICLSMLSYGQCVELGAALAQVIGQAGEPVLMLASTDMTHYESADSAKLKDQLALEQLLELNGRGLYNVVTGHGISMCGVLPTTVVVEAANRLGAEKCELVAYTNSGEVSGDFQQVVGYAGLIIS